MADTVTLTIPQARRVVEALGWELETTCDDADGICYRYSSPDLKACSTQWYTNEKASLFFVLAAHVGNGHWKPGA